jgi:hypothetical protein
LREQGALGANPEYEQSIEIVVILRNLPAHFFYR